MQLLSLFSLATFASAAAIESRDTCSYATPGQLAFSRQALVNAKIVPPTRAQFRPTGSYVNLEDTFDPRVAVSVKYGEKAVNFGNTFSPVETLNEPTISFTAEYFRDPYNTKYTIIMADPDAPNPENPILGNFLHLIISDAQPECVKSQQRKTVASYMAPTPLSATPHRYTFFVYRQPPGYVAPLLLSNTPAARNNFNVTKYADDNKLVGPIGGNFYREGLATTLPVGQ